MPGTLINITGSDDRYLTKLFDGKKVFDYPKPLKLLDYLIKIGTKENDVVLDFFAGSGSTGESCFNNNRQFMLVSIDEAITPIELKDKTINTIYQLTKERLIRAKVNFKEFYV